MQKTFKNMWVCVSPQGEIKLYTHKWYRKDSVKELLSGGSLSWKQCYYIGWRCVKVNVTFEVKE